MYLDSCYEFFAGLAPDHRRAVFLALGNTRYALAKGCWFSVGENEKEICCPLIMAIAAIRLVSIGQLYRELKPLGTSGAVDYVSQFFGVRRVHVVVFLTRWDRSTYSQGLRFRQRMAAEVNGYDQPAPAVDPGLVARAHESGRTPVGVSANNQLMFA